MHVNVSVICCIHFLIKALLWLDILVVAGLVINGSFIFIFFSCIDVFNVSEGDVA